MTFKPFQRPQLDARACGARCDQCPLKDRLPVGPELPKRKPKLIILGESPGKDENYQGRPFVGKTGKWLDEQLAAAGFDRGDALVTNAVACLPLKAMSKGKWKQAREACAPRLKKELDQFPGVPVLALGEHALAAVSDVRGAASNWVGYPLQSNGRWVLPNYHPTFAAFYRPELRNVFATWLRRAVRLANGEFKFWQWPTNRILSQNDSLLQKAFESCSKSDVLVIDIESIPGVNTLTRMGISNGEWTISLPWDYYQTKKYGTVVGLRPELKEQIKELLATKDLVAHNGQFDIVYLKSLGFKLKNDWGLVHDTLAGHAACNQQEPHDLGYVATSSFCIPRYKSEFKALGNEKGSDRWVEVKEEDMAIYNAGDAYVTWLEYQRQKQEITKRPEARDRFDELMALLNVTLKMKYHGWRVDKSALGIHRDRLSAIVAEKRTLILRAAKAAGFRKVKKFKKKQAQEIEFNPSSTKDIRQLFSKCLGVGVIKTNPETNEASFDVEVLEKLVTHPDQRVSLMARLMLEYREKNKLLTAYASGKHLQDDGMFHPSWNPWGAISGRFSCHEPAVQTIPPGMRNIFVTSNQDKWIVEADYSQLEMVIAAYGAGAKLLIEWLTEGKDTHLETAKKAFNDPNMKKDDIRRQASKKVNYSLLYGAGIDKIYTDLKIEFPDISRAMVEKVYEDTKKIHPELIALINETKIFAEREGYSSTFITGRRRYSFGEDVDLPALFNHRIQGTAADLTNRALIGISSEIDWNKERILGQVHDAIVMETDDVARTAERLKRWLELPVLVNGVERVFKSDIKFGRSWSKKELEDYHEQLADKKTEDK